MIARMQISRLDSAGADAKVATIETVVQSALEEIDTIDLSWIPRHTSGESWSLSTTALRFLVSLVKHLKPRHIVEFGSGLSTHVLARSCAELDLSCRITSIDNDPEFGDVTARNIRELKLNNIAKIQIAPLVARDCAGRILPQYLLKRKYFASQRLPDLVVIDGPPAALGGREGIMYQVMDFTQVGTLVLLDDANRPGEKDALSKWQANLGNAIKVNYLPGFAKGMAAIVVREPIPISKLLEHRLCLIREEIAALIPSESTFILVNDNNWNAGDTLSDRRIIPFLEREGQYWGPPADDTSAIQELERLRQSGATSIVFTWPSFWWLDYYSEFHNYLRSNYQYLFDDERIVMFKLSR
jgi:predicted O-methyltransferase YrrM